MTPEEKFNQEIWWILQEIKHEEYRTPKGEEVEFFIKKNVVKKGNQKINIDFNFPEEEVQRKLLHKLKEWNAISFEPVNDIFRGSDMYSPSIYALKIKKTKFDELYKKYEAENNLRENEQWVKPILKKLESGKLLYKKDELIYSLWKYANAGRLTGKNLISFTDLSPLEGSSRFAIFEFVSSLRGLKIELEDITFHEDIYKVYCRSEYEYILDYVAKNPKTDFSKAINKLFRNKATFEDIFQIFGEIDGFMRLKIQLSGLFDFVEFNPLPSKKNIEPLKDHLEIYFNCFIEDKLFSSELKNFYRFLRQKEIFLQNIEREVKNYGLEFVFRQGESVAVIDGAMISIDKDDSYLFFHILASLEKQGYFEVESVLITDMDVPPEKQTDDYKIKIIANEKLLKEYELKSQHSPEHIQKIQIVDSSIEVNGLKEGFGSIIKEKKEISTLKFPYKLPAGIEWKNFIIQFLNEEEVYIKVNRFKHSENYIKMGFVDNRFSISRPSEGWVFLRILAKYNGELTINDPDAKDKYKKQKELLSKNLKSYFSMESDPFYSYQETKSYKTRFTLLPPSEESDKKKQLSQEKINRNSIDKEIRDYFQEQTPHIYDE